MTTRASRDEWALRVRRWERSGLSAGGFAAREAVSAKSLAWWRWKLGGRAAVGVRATRGAVLGERGPHRDRSRQRSGGARAHGVRRRRARAGARRRGAPMIPGGLCI